MYYSKLNINQERMSLLSHVVFTGFVNDKKEINNKKDPATLATLPICSVFY